MKLSGTEFFYLELESDRYLFEEREDAVEKLKEEASNIEDPRGSKIFHVDTEGDKWDLEQVPWSEIAVEMMTGGH